MYCLLIYKFADNENDKITGTFENYMKLGWHYASAQNT